MGYTVFRGMEATQYTGSIGATQHTGGMGLHSIQGV